MLAALCPQQRAMVLDPSPYVSALCPRRAGKTFAAALAALITGEANPGSICLIISLNLKQLRRLYWSGSASGLYTLAKKFKLNLEFNSTYLRWDHENGSCGYLLGCEDEDQMEVIRGQEADLCVIDECKSFAPARLNTLIEEILDPVVQSRNGRVVMIGTPGFHPAGPFYQATCPESLDSDQRPYFIVAGTAKDRWGRTAFEDGLWSFHTWSAKDNPAPQCQNFWKAGIRKKKNKKWGDDHPVWLREYMAKWTYGGEGLVFRYSKAKIEGKCTWVPQRDTEATPPDFAGLPPEGAPWRFIAGLDFGYEAPTAFVVCAYSRRMKQLRHVYDIGKKHMLVDDIAEMIRRAYEMFGPIEKIYADRGNLGKTLVATLVEEYGFPIEAADKREKNDYIELLNNSFESGEILIIENTTLETQLLTNAWDLDGDDEAEKEALARMGKLVEDKNIPNDYSDALVYCYRGSLHRFGTTEAEEEPIEGTPEYFSKWEKDQLKKVRQQFAREERQMKTGKRLELTAPSFVRRALDTRQWKNSPQWIRRQQRTHSVKRSTV